MKISREQAEKEVTEWLDFKKISDTKREAYKDNIEQLVEAIASGRLILKEDKVFQLNLAFPIGEDKSVAVPTFEFQPRLKIKTLQHHMQGVSPKDPDGRVLAYVAALTSQPKGIIKEMDTEDYNAAQAIAIFFL